MIRDNVRKAITKACPSDWSVELEEEDNGRIHATFEAWSPRGGDVIVEVWFDGSVRDLCSKLYDYYQGFDPEEEAENYFGAPGAPEDDEEIVDDMFDRRNMLRDLANAYIPKRFEKGLVGESLRLRGHMLREDKSSPEYQWHMGQGVAFERAADILQNKEYGIEDIPSAIEFFRKNAEIQKNIAYNHL